MPDQSEVSQSLVTLIAGAVYPNGTAKPSVTTDPISIREGWPIEQDLMTWLGMGSVAVSILPMPGERVGPSSLGGDEFQANATTIVQTPRSQTKSFKITIWAPTNGQRDAVSSVVDSMLSGISCMAFADSTIGRLRYAGSTQSDDQQKAGIYRRDLTYSVEYATTQSLTATAIAHPIIYFTPGTITGDSVPTPIIIGS